MLLKLLMVVALIYGAVVAAVYFAQTQVLFLHWRISYTCPCPISFALSAIPKR